MKIEVGLKYKIVNGVKNIGTVYKINRDTVFVYFDSNTNDVGNSSINNFIESIEKGELIVINDFKLPEKWCVEGTKQNEKILQKYFSKFEYSYRWDYSYGYFYISNGSVNWSRESENTEIIEITFEQFKKYVLGLKENLLILDCSCLIEIFKRLKYETSIL